jgi:cephalosporin hydroxylase
VDNFILQFGILKKEKNMKMNNFEQRNSKMVYKMSRDKKLKDISLSWMIESSKYEYGYNFKWMGRPIIQLPQDIVEFQELVWQVKPDLIIETGIAHGGSLILSASMLSLIEYSEAIGNRKLLDPQKPERMVLGIDIDIREHNKKAIEAHSMSNRIKMLEGSSIDAGIISQVKDYAKDFKNIIVCLDSNHTHDHVLAELNAFADLVAVGSYCIVWDTVIEDMPEDSFGDRPWDKLNNPKTAVAEFLKTRDDFVVDEDIQNKLLITVAPDGYLRRL